MEIDVLNTIQDLDIKEWESLAGTQSAEQSYGWFKTVEDSGMRDMYYVIVRENKRLTAAACAHVYYKRIFALKVPFILVGSPLGTSHAFFSHNPAQTGALLTGLKEVQKKVKAQGLILSYLDEKSKDLKGFVTLPMMDDTYIDLEFADFNEYLLSLRYKVRKSIKNTLKRTERLGVKTVVTNDFLKWKDTACTLQGYLCEEHNDYEWHLTGRFYESLETHFKENAELLVFLRDDIPLACILALYVPGVVHYRFAGVDPDYREYQAYFLIYYEGIKRAIEKRQKRAYYGLTTYEFKERIGCKRKPLFEAVKMDNPFIHLSLQSYAKFSTMVGVDLFK